MSNLYSVIRQPLPAPEYVPRPKPTEIPAAAWNDEPLFCLAVNDEWVSHILGVLAALDQPDTWIGTEEEIFAARQQVNEMMLALMTACEESVTVQYPQHVTLWHDEASIVSGGALVRGSLADSPYFVSNSFYNTITYQATAADSDSFSQSFLADAGDYIFRALGAHNNVHGKVDWYLDDESEPFTTQDWYGASVEANIIKSASVSIAAAGRHTLTGVVNGRNPSNTLAYALPLTKYWLEYVP